MACPRTRLLAFLVLGAFPTMLPGQVVPQWRHIRDRGPGVTSSLAALDIEQGQLLIHPYFAYVWDQDREYKPAEFGVGPDIDFRARTRTKAAQLVVGVVFALPGRGARK